MVAWVQTPSPTFHSPTVSPSDCVEEDLEAKPERIACRDAKTPPPTLPRCGLGCVTREARPDGKTPSPLRGREPNPRTRRASSRDHEGTEAGAVVQRRVAERIRRTASMNARGPGRSCPRPCP